MSSTAGSTPPSPEEPPRGWIERVGAALSHRNYRVLWLAALGSTIGTWMQGYAQSWLVFELTKSNFYLGLDAFLGQLPILLLMLIGGVIADRHDRRRLLTGSQYVQAFSALSLAVLVATDHITIPAIFILSFISGCGQSFGGPAYQAMIPSLVPRRDLPNAIALNSTQFNLSRALGPAMGGLVLSWIGAAWCFGLNGFSYFLVVIALANLRLPAHVPSTTKLDIGAELRSGLKHVRDSRVLTTLTVLAFVTASLAMPVSTFFPTFAAELNGSFTSAQRLSMLMACQGLGAIAGALIVGTIGPLKRMGRALLVTQILLGLCIISFAMSRSLPLSLILIFAAGMCSMAVFSMSFSLVQLTVPDALRGRIVSIYMVALRSGAPIGALVAGAFADRFTASVVITISAGILATVATSLLLRRNGTLQNV